MLLLLVELVDSGKFCRFLNPEWKNPNMCVTNLGWMDDSGNLFKRAQDSWIMYVTFTGWIGWISKILETPEYKMQNFQNECVANVGWMVDSGNIYNAAQDSWNMCM